MQNVVELTTTDWTKIKYNSPQGDNGFTFRSDADISFAQLPSPAIDESIPLTSETKYIFKKPETFWVKGTIGTKIFLAPFDK